MGIPFSCTLSVVDKNGRYIFLRGNLEGLDCILANVYIPPPFSAEVLKILAGFLAHHPNVPALKVGDFNNYLNFQLDKLTVAHPCRLHYACCLKNIQTRIYSCLSASHRGLSRIDLGLCNEEMLSHIADAQY